ncbi:MAG: hypothetical protein AABZ23_00730 [Deltaproteobacteria bacterium]
MRKEDCKYPILKENLRKIIEEQFGGIPNRLRDKLGISGGAFQRYVKGIGHPGAKTLQKIQEVTGYSSSWLLYGEPVPSPLPGWLLTGLDTEEVEVYNEDERAQCKKLLRILRTKQDKTVSAIRQNIDAFLDTPDKDTAAKSPLGKKETA